MPNQPATPARAVRIDDDLWGAVLEAAELEGSTASDVVRSALRAYLAPVARRPRKAATRPDRTR